MDEPCARSTVPTWVRRWSSRFDRRWPIGSNGWYPHREDKALYDQQPVEAITMADAALAAFAAMNDPRYLATFRRAQGWFHGENSLHQPLAMISSGACCDGLQPSSVNRNQGAESTLSFLSTELLRCESLQLLGDGRRATSGKR